MTELNALDWLAIILVAIGALNWGLVGLFRIDLVRSLFGEESGLSRFVYTLVGLGGIYLLILMPNLVKT